VINITNPKHLQQFETIRFEKTHNYFQQDGQYSNFNDENEKKLDLPTDPYAFDLFLTWINIRRKSGL